MFESPPTNLPIEPAQDKEPEDIFGTTEKSKISPSAPSLAGAGVSKTTSVSPIKTPPEPISPPVDVKPPIISSPIIIWVIGIVAALIVLVGGGYGLAKFLQKAQLPSAPETSTETSTEVPLIGESLEENLAPAETPSETPVETVAPEQVAPVAMDTDGDGLLDSEETQWSTDSNNPDTDADGLLDGEEINTYGTDPKNPDTDGDTFLDGQEVRNGFNPKGEGRLFELPQ
ncbi:MAG: hypothetical protein Q8M83_06100 [bacterium]|nr:hypothetical protein [bacterium]